jgi:hypothetical protein
LLICVCWEAFERVRLPRRLAVTLFLLAGLSAWCRSTWYLFPLVPGTLWLAGRRRSGWRTLVICMAGVAAGACLTGHPWLYFRESLHHLLDATQRGVPSWMLVTEFTPRAPALQGLSLVGGLLLWRGLRGLPVVEAVRDPCFYLWAGATLLGFQSVRFAIDFGVPALLVWVARQIEALAAPVPGLRDDHGWPRLALAAGAALVFTVSATADLSARYSGCLLVKTLDADSDREWLPGSGGIFYSISMGLFFNTFYANPEAPWRYVLGFEPGMMTETNRKIHEGIIQSGQDSRFFEPWVRMMRPEDRLVIEAGKDQPSVPGLEWHNIRGGIWSGRLQAEPPADAGGKPDTPEVVPAAAAGP